MDTLTDFRTGISGKVMKTYIVSIGLILFCACGDRANEGVFCDVDSPCVTLAEPFCDVDGDEVRQNECSPVPASAVTCNQDSECMGIEGLCNEEASFCTQCWNLSEDGNAACAVKDATTPECRNDGACSCTDTSCSGATPFCGSDGQCRGCMIDTECDSGVCDLDNGQCISETNILYVDPSGSGSACSKSSPCATMTTAETQMSPTRSTILLSASVHLTAESFAQTVHIVGEDGAIVEVEDMVVSGANSRIRNISFRNQAGIIASGDGAVISNVTVEGNDGPGITASGGGTLVVSQSVLRENTGPGIRVSDDRSFTVENCIIEDNGAEGIQLVSQNMTTLTQEINFSTIANNGGSDITCASGSAFSITNSIVWGAAGISDVAQCSFTYTTVEGVVPPGAGNKNDDPIFVDMVNYELSVGSPAIDAADPASTITTDVDGTTRPQGTAPDMGAQEFTP